MPEINKFIFAMNIRAITVEIAWPFSVVRDRSQEVIKFVSSHFYIVKMAQKFLWPIETRETYSPPHWRTKQFKKNSNRLNEYVCIGYNLCLNKGHTQLQQLYSKQCATVFDFTNVFLTKLLS